MVTSTWVRICLVSEWDLQVWLYYCIWVRSFVTVSLIHSDYISWNVLYKTSKFCLSTGSKLSYGGPICFQIPGMVFYCLTTLQNPMTESSFIIHTSLIQPMTLSASTEISAMACSLVVVEAVHVWICMRRQVAACIQAEVQNFEQFI